MRDSRLLQLLLLLVARERMTAAEVARELEVSRRTALRYVDALSAAGVPVYADRGRHGGIRLASSFRRGPTALTLGEVEALVVAGVRRHVDALGLGPDLRMAQLKLLAGAGRSAGSAARVAAGRVHVDDTAWFTNPEIPPALRTLTDGLWQGRRVRVLHRRHGAETAREHVLEPWGLVVKDGRWYVVAGGEPPVVYRVDRIASAELLTESAGRPAPDFELDLFWTRWKDRFEKSVHRYPIILRVRLADSDDVAGQLGEAIWASRSELRRDDAAVTVELMHENLRYALADVLALGGKAEVVAPTELRRAVHAAALRLARRHQADRKRPPSDGGDV